MKPRLLVLALCVAGFGVSLAAVPQSAPPPPPTPPPTIQGVGGGRGGVVGSVLGGIPNQPGRSTQPTAPLVTTSLIVGRVIDAASGKGVPGAVVTLTGGPSRVAMPVQPGQPPQASGPPPPPPQILTDNEGRYAFLNLTRGNYNISATKSGYSAGGYGRLRPNGPTRQVQLDDGEKMPEANIRIFKFASIAGTVVDDAGEPVVSTAVRVYRRVLMSGRRVLTPAGGQAQTDDRGMYRLANLTPGEYVVVVPVVPVTVPNLAQPGGNRPNLQATGQGLSVGAPVPGIGGQALGSDPRFLLQRNVGMSGEIAAAADSTGRVLGFATVYYPNSATVSGAQPVAVASGEERGGVDFAMRRVPTVAISGLITGADGPAADFVIRLVPTDTGDIIQEPESAVAMSDPSGSFLFFGVPAGQYVLQAMRIPRPAPPVEMARLQELQAQIGKDGRPTAINLAPTAEPLLWAMASVSVSDADVHGIALTLREGLTIGGRLEFSGTRARPEPQRLTQVPIVVEPADGRSQQFNSGPPSRVQPSGQFVTTGQLPGRYFIRVGGAPAGWSVQSITANGIDVTETPIELSTGSINNVVVTFTDLTQDVRGTVSGVPAGADAPVVIVFPSDSTAWKNFGVNPMRMRSSRVAPNAMFSVNPLPAGDYFAVAIPDEYSSEWQDPAYLDLLSRTAARFSLAPGERRTLDLTLQDVKPPSIGRQPPPSPLPIPQSLEESREVERDHGPFETPEGAVQGSPPQQVRDTRVAPPVGAGSISGVVRADDGSIVPARFARVSVRAATLPAERTTLADSEGRYSIVGLPAGTYQVYVAKAAYLTTYYGAKRPMAPQGTPIRVDPSQSVTGIDITLKKGGVVTGVVIGTDGEPAPGVRVQLLQRVLTDGEPRLTGAPTSGQPVTDDRGMFRLFGLRPGSYAISATPSVTVTAQAEVRQLSDQEIRTAMAEAAAGKVATNVANRTLAPGPAGPLPAVPPAGRPVGFSAVYYPGTTNEEEAGVFTVTAGQEMRISISLQLVPTARLEGTVVTADGQPAPVQGLSLTLNRSVGSSTFSSAVRMLEPGRFQAVGVPPGRYLLTARMNSPEGRPGGPAQPPGPPTQWFAQQDVDVMGADLSGISLTLGPPMTISGKVVFDGGAPPGDAQVQVRLDSAGRNPTGSFARVLKTGENGDFTITGVTPGRYRLNASVLIQNASPGPAIPPGWSVKSATIDGRDALESSFDVQAGRAPQTAVVTMTTRLPQLSATITDKSGRGVTSMICVLFSTSREHWTGNTSRRVRSQIRPTDDGTYQFNSILPGEYFLAVLSDLDQPDLYDPSFLEQLVPAAIRITLAEGDKKTQTLRIAGG